jgi:hypothetical protein
LNFLEKSTRPDIRRHTQWWHHPSTCPRQVIWNFCRRGFCRKLASNNRTGRPKYRQIPLRIRDQLRRLSDRLGIQIADDHRALKYWSRIRQSIWSSTRYDTTHGSYQRVQGQWI